MHRLHSVSSSAAGGKFPDMSLKDFPPGLLAVALILHLAYPGTVATAGMTSNLATEANVSTILDSMIGSFTLGYGRNAARKVYTACQGSELRHVQRAALGHECWLNWDLTSTGAKTLSADVVIPFEVPGMRDGNLRLPGTTQVKSMQIEMVEGSSISISAGGALTRTAGNVTLDLDVLSIPSPDGRDQWSPVLSYAKVNASELAPKAPKMVNLLAWLSDSAYASTGLTFLSTKVDDQPLASTVPLYVPFDAYVFRWAKANPAWSISSTNGIVVQPLITDSNTVLFSPVYGGHTSRLPAGAFSFSNPSQAYNPYHLRVIGWPMLETDEALEASAMCAETAQGGVLMGHPTAATLDQYPDTHVGSLPLIAFRASEPEFALRAGVLTPAKGAPPSISIPPHVSGLVDSQVQAAGASGAATAQAANRAAAVGLARSIPGLAASASAAGSAGSITPIVSAARKLSADGSGAAILDRLNRA